MRKVRRIDASKYDYEDERRYISLKDCPTEPEVVKAYCDTHPSAVCWVGMDISDAYLKGERGKISSDTILRRSAIVAKMGLLFKAVKLTAEEGHLLETYRERISLRIRSGT